jgi:hypothetical protein
MDLDYRRYIPISSNRVYIYKAFTVREFRGKHVLPGFYGFISDYLKQNGYNSVVVRVGSRNLPALAGTTKGGFRPVGNIIRIRMLSDIKCIISRELRMRLLSEDF